MGFQHERARVTLAGALETMKPGRYLQRRPDAPWGSPRQETPAFLCRQLGDTFQVHVDAGLERRNHSLERFAVHGDVEIRADGVPWLAAPVGIALQGVHVGSTGGRAAPRIRQVSMPVLLDDRTQPGDGRLQSRRGRAVMPRCNRRHQVRNKSRKGSRSRRFAHRDPAAGRATRTMARVVVRRFRRFPSCQPSASAASTMRAHAAASAPASW